MGLNGASQQMRREGKDSGLLEAVFQRFGQVERILGCSWSPKFDYVSRKIMLRYLRKKTKVSKGRRHLRRLSRRCVKRSICFLTSREASSLDSWRYLVHFCLTPPNTFLSSGWRKAVCPAGRQTTSISFSCFRQAQKSPTQFTWEECPSKNNTFCKTTNY